jgi:hypothetical protein
MRFNLKRMTVGTLIRLVEEEDESLKPIYEINSYLRAGCMIDILPAH